MHRSLIIAILSIKNKKPDYKYSFFHNRVLYLFLVLYIIIYRLPSDSLFSKSYYLLNVSEIVPSNFEIFIINQVFICHLHNLSKDVIFK